MHALRAFEACARHLSVSRAAEELNLTQSTVSRQLLGLEQMLGVPLFRRVRKRMVLTAAGTSYASEVRASLARLAGAAEKIARTDREQTTLTVAVGSTFGSRWLVPHLADFQRRHPKVTLDLVSYRRGRGPYDFATEEVDAAIYFGDDPWGGVKCHRLCGEVAVPVCAPALLPRRVSASRLIKLPLLHLRARPDAWMSWFEKAGVDSPTLSRGSRFQTMEMMCDAATAGLGVALMPTFLIGSDLATGRLIVASEPPIRLSGGYYLSYPEGESSRALRSFRKWLLEHPHLTE